ncbi:MAG: DMT family transporter [Collinsella sp.]
MWGSIGIFVNGISAMGVSSQSMAAFRLLVGALILAPVLMFMGCRPGEGSTVAQGPLALFKASPKELVPCALVGIVGLAAANTCYYECMGEVGMSTASVLLYTSPVFGVMLGRVLYREDVTPNKLVAIVFNIVGCVLAVTNGDLSGFHFSVWGVTSGVIAGLCGASLAVFSRIATKTVHPLAVTFWGFVFGGAVMAAIAAPWPDVAAAMSPQLLLLFLGFGLIPTAVAYILYMQGLSMGLETSKVPVVMSFETVVTVLVGIGVYAEPAGAIKSWASCGARVHPDYEHRLLKLRNSVFVGHVIESMTFKPNAWWTEKSQDMDLFKERTGIALEPTVQESPGTSCDRGLRAGSDLGLSS